jgi:hypothetical protein
MTTERAASGRGVAVGLAGMSVAVLTFTLFFLFPQDQLGKIDRPLFHLTLDVIVGGLFALTFSTLYYSRAMMRFQSRASGAPRLVVTAYLFLLIGMALFTLAAALVLFTVRLWDVGTLAIGLWIVLQALAFASTREFT